MSKVSIIIPARGETTDNVHRTLANIVENATGEYEVIIGFDGFSETDKIISETLDYDADIKFIPFPNTVGIKTNINAMAAMATGKYIYKSDAHCRFSKGFDEILQQDMEEDWIVMPRFYVLDEKTWEWQDDRFYDYFYLSCPFTDPRGLRFKAGGHWPEKTKEKLDTLIDETPQIHGSGWFISKSRYFDGLGGFPNIDVYGHAQEPIWLALKNWLMGGKVMVNKKCWYAHMHQQTHGYHIDRRQNERTYNITADYWLRDKFPDKIHDFEWFVDKFMPMPTWPDNWRALLHDWRIKNAD